MSSSSRPPHRSGLKTAPDAHAALLRRRETSTQFRRAARAGRLASKRRVSMGPGLNASASWTPAELQAVLRSLQESSGAGAAAELAQALQALHRILACDAQDPPLSAVAHAGVLPLLQELIGNAESGAKPTADGRGTLQLQALLCVANLATGDMEAHPVLAQGLQRLAPQLVLLTQSPGAEVAEAAVWALGNLAGEAGAQVPAEQDLRRRLRAAGAMEALAALATAAEPGVKRATVYWALSNLARGADAMAGPFVKALSVPERGFVPLATLRDCLGALGEAEAVAVATEVCWLLTYLTAREVEVVEALLGLGLGDAMAAAMGAAVGATRATREAQTSIFGLATPALRTCGNVLSGPDRWCGSLLRNTVDVDIARVLAWALSLGTASSNPLTLEALWVLGNVCLLRDEALTPVFGHLADCGALATVLDLLLGTGAGQWTAAALQREALVVLRNLAGNIAVPPDFVVSLIRSRGAGLDVVKAWVERLTSQSDVEVLHICVFLLGYAMERMPEALGWASEEGFAEPLDAIHYDPRMPPELQREAARLAELVYAYEEEQNEQVFNPNETAFTFQPQAVTTPFAFGVDAAGSAGIAPEAGAGRGRGRGRGLDNRPAWMQAQGAQPPSLGGV